MPSPGLFGSSGGKAGEWAINYENPGPVVAEVFTRPRPIAALTMLTVLTVSFQHPDHPRPCAAFARM
jgi:hypothetical protein